MKNPIIGRRRTRELIVQFLFQNDFNPEPLDDALPQFWDDKKISEKEKIFAEKLIFGVIKNKESLDKKMSDYADNWKSERLGSVDRVVIRIALFEILHCDDVPPIVSINEAVHFANDLSSFKSGKFVNGILDRVLNDIDRPHRKTSFPND